MQSSREQGSDSWHNPYESPTDVANEPITGISPEESIAQHKAKFARYLRQIRTAAIVMAGLFLIVVAIASLAVMLSVGR